MVDITHSLFVERDPEYVWLALTTFGGIERWWTLGETTLTGDVAADGQFQFQSRQVITRIKVAVSRRPKHLEWRVIESNAPGGWDATSIMFDLIPESGGTRVEFAHRNFATANEGFHRVTAGWAHYLQNLKQAVEADDDRVMKASEEKK